MRSAGKLSYKKENMTDIKTGCSGILFCYVIGTKFSIT